MVQIDWICDPMELTLDSYERVESTQKSSKYGQYWGATEIFWLFCVRPICVQVRSNENPVGSTHFVGPYG